MSVISIKRAVEIERTPRVIQAESMFDIPPSKRSEMSWDAHLPIDERPWNVGLIHGPSGCGKSTVAREMFGECLAQNFTWDAGRSVLDAFPPKMPIKTILNICGSVGFNSPPSWLRPFAVLSNGEQFRVTIARAIAEAKDLLVVDEFTSVVDRQVAKIASHSIQKFARNSQIKFVAVSCHDDIIDWLQPDWIYQPGADDFHWRHLQRRPTLNLEVNPIDKAAWRHFKHHHYMSGSLGVRAECVGGFIDGKCVAFAAWLPFPHPLTKNIMHGHRLVVLPDYQGLNIGGRMDDWIGQYLWEKGYRYRNVVAHPAMVAYYKKSPRWVHMYTARGHGNFSGKSKMKARILNATQRIISSFEYIAPKAAS